MKLFSRAFLAAIILGGLVLASVMRFGTVEASDAGDIPKPSVPEFTVAVDGRHVSLIIENQPFVSYYDDGWNVVFYYNVRLNGEELYRASDGYPAQSSSEYTTISYYIQENADSKLGVYLWRIDTDTLNFQVEAMIGYVHRVVIDGIAPWVFTGEKNGWSETQTVTIGQNSDIPEFPLSVILPLFLTSTLVVIIIRKRLGKTGGLSTS